jgi:hypothetical protein
MIIIETSIFTKRICKLLSDDNYRSLQNYLVKHPDAGDIITGSGGLRKIRWSLENKGKRGGTRIIYYFIKNKQKIIMLYAFAKNECDDLSQDQLKMIKKIMENNFYER